MRIGVPTEIKTDEYRVALTPAGVRELVEHGHDVLIQSGAGEGSAIPDADYVKQGARIGPDAESVFAEAEKTGAAILAYPVHGTLKRVAESGVIDQTVRRADLWEAQTPQVFHKELLIRAYEQDLSGVTDDAQLVESLGHPVSAVLGDPRNIKITTPEDLRFAAAVINSLPKPKLEGPSHPFAEAQW